MTRHISFVASLLLLFSTASFLPAREIPFATADTVTTGADGVAGVYVTDIDGDGDLDIISSSNADTTVAWYENTNGTGTFGSANIISPSTSGTFHVAAADIDGDGDQDVFTTSINDDELAWHENTDGTGTFGPAQVFTSSEDAIRSIFPADLDCDGDVDLLAAAVFNNSITWYENTDGMGTFSTPTTITTLASGSTGVYAADFDNDGDLDVLGGSQTDNEMAWYENTDGNGTFGPQNVISNLATSVQRVFAADIDGDGDQDAIGTRANNIIWFENTDGAGTFGPFQVISDAASTPADVFAADVDGDGDMDVLHASIISDTFAWHENTDGQGTFAPQWVITNSADFARTIFAADIDGDGDTDVVGGSATDDTVAWFENQTIHRSAEFPTLNSITTSASGANSVDSGDIDNDGDTDILFSALTTGNVAWIRNNGGGSFVLGQNIDFGLSGVQTAHAADLDKDGDLDVIAANTSGVQLQWYENTNGMGTYGSANTTTNTLNTIRNVNTADIDGDGDLDILTASEGDNRITWFDNTDGDASAFTQNVITSAATGAYDVDAGDIDGDGDIDVVYAAAAIDDIGWLENTDGAGTFGAGIQSISGDADGPVSIRVGDIDGDGDLDVIAGSADDDEIAWYENTDGAGSFGGQLLITTAADSLSRIRVADLDQDGDLDVMSASGFDNKIAWYENLDGAGTFGSQEIITTSASSASGVAFADLDKDGDIDVISSSSFDDRIAWYPNQGGQFGLPTIDTAPATLDNAMIDDFLRITATHLGRSGDGTVELTSLELQFEESTGSFYDTAFLNAVVENLFIYVDNGDGVFNIGSDDEVLTSGSITVGPLGIASFNFVDGDPDAAISQGTPVMYFVVVELTADAMSQPLNTLQITHITESSSTAEDRENDIPLILEYSANVTSTNTAAVPVELSAFDIE